MFALATRKQEFKDGRRTEFTRGIQADWQLRQLIVMCAVCLVLGFLAGYLLRGSASAPLPTEAHATGSSSQPTASTRDHCQRPSRPKKTPTLDDLKRMADKKAAPLLEKLKSDPKNPQLEIRSA